MPNFLTSWKEIGQYLGKGVRTVQRWEREASLPVRRNVPPSRPALLAIPEELDEWMRSRTRGPTIPVAETLRKELTTLREENSELRKRVEFVEARVFGSRKRLSEVAETERSRSLGVPGPSEAEC